MSLHARIDRALTESPLQGVVWIALSGGCDSVCLLHLAARARQRHDVTLRALHVHHGLQVAADDFAAHCRMLCAALDVPLVLEHVAVTSDGGGNLEALAREARYNAFAKHVDGNDVLWLAHHRDDQAETVLLRLMRGAGVTGLGAMPAARALGGARLLRPLLDVGRDELRTYAKQHDLAWIDDLSNEDERFDRNYLRHRVLPALKARWPAAEAQLAASARHAREAAGLLDDLAALDLERLGNEPGRLPCVGLLAMSMARQRLLIRYCLARMGLALPGEQRLTSLLAQLGVRQDGEAQVNWPGGEGRIWRRTLFLMTPQVSLPAGWQAIWDGGSALETPTGMLRWRLSRTSGVAQRVTLTPRRGGERLYQRSMSRRLKTLLQTAGLPPWERDRLILAWHADELVAVLGDTCALVADGWQVSRR